MEPLARAWVCAKSYGFVCIGGTGMKLFYSMNFYVLISFKALEDLSSAKPESKLAFKKKFAGF